ncbi:hypothetical protein TIFTF001_001588 [Ficus carica]|uniref:Uncharacterized protein n=1 Tax=Ficus carica TaxID=3494 RepID=A0AA87ZH65_FICCA|nr:hypothetical protein TIFTF001_001588 [Ficus carica]
MESRSGVGCDRSHRGVTIWRRILPWSHDQITILSWSRDQRRISPWIRSSRGNSQENCNRSSSFPSTSDLHRPCYDFSDGHRQALVFSG